MAEVFPNKDNERVILVNIDDEIHGVMTHPDVWFDMTTKGLEQWCELHNVDLTGMVLVFPDYETVMMFRLEWGM